MIDISAITRCIWADSKYDIFDIFSLRFVSVIPSTTSLISIITFWSCFRLLQTEISSLSSMVKKSMTFLPFRFQQRSRILFFSTLFRWFQWHILWCVDDFSFVFFLQLAILPHNLNLTQTRFVEKERLSHQPIRFVSLVGAESTQ